MINLYDFAYGVSLGVTAPFWLAKSTARRKVFNALHDRMGNCSPRVGDEPAVLIHAVSLGEMNATRALVGALADARADLKFIVTTTTETGFNRGREIYGNDSRITLIHYPLDFSVAVNRVLDNLRPSIVVLMELEVWPNFVYQCERRKIPVVLVNGRLTTGSFRNYRRGGMIVKRMFGRLAAVCAQEQLYADRFILLGARAECVRMTGTMKFDNAQIADRIAGADELASAVGLNPGLEPIWVCGSTGPGEEQLILDIYRQLLVESPQLRLVLVPRKPERFDEVAKLIESSGFSVVRRSQSPDHNPDPSDPMKSNARVILGDTMGELRKFYSLADIVFVGRTLIDLGARQHGSDMIEPAALAKPTIVGPYTGNFTEVMNLLRSANAIMEVASANDLKQVVGEMLSSQETVTKMGQRAREVVRSAQGATARNTTIIRHYLPPART